MTPEAREALVELLAAAERRADRGESPDGATFPFTETRLPSYYSCTVAQLVDLHADLSVVERTGAISIDWDPRAAERSRILRLRTVDAGKLAAAVGRPARWDTISIAERELAHWRALPRVQRLLVSWRTGKSPRSKASDSWPEWRDALHVLDSLPKAIRTETPLRRLSNTLFGDSKRIEKLAPCLDYLTAVDQDELQRDSSDLFSGLGLPRYPQPMLIATYGSALRLVQGGVVPPVEPYIGLAPERLSGFEQPPDFVLTVENLSSFNEAARQQHAGANAALIYTAGMPGPRFIDAYRRLLQSAPGTTEVLHWGDMDLGGLRIASKLASAASAAGIALKLHDFVRNINLSEGRKELSAREKSAMISICEQWGWLRERDFVLDARWAREQEEDVPRLPWADTN